jgi:hypothetical protein
LKSKCTCKRSFSVAPPSGLKIASNAVEKLLGDVSNCTLINLFENLIRDTQLLSWIMTSDDERLAFTSSHGLI